MFRELAPDTPLRHHANNSSLSQTDADAGNDHIKKKYNLYFFLNMKKKLLFAVTSGRGAGNDLIKKKIH